MLTRALIVATAVTTLAALAAPSAWADAPEGGGICDGPDSYVSVCADEPGKKPSGSKQPAKSNGGHTKPPVCTPPKKMEPQPPAGSDLWEGHDPSDGGAVYVRTCLYTIQGGATKVTPEALYGGPGGPPAAVAPVVVAQQAVDRMLLRGPRIGITPKPGGRGVVGMPVYMWTGRGSETYGPNTASATAGAVTVTATAKVSKIVWSMGDGQAVTCTTAGTPYTAEFGKKPSPDCGYRYTQPSSTQESGKYHVTATSTWTIDWTGGGQSGQLTEIRDSDVDITVAEVQVLN